MFLNGFTSLRVVLCFPISILTALSLCTVFDAISSNIDEVHLINSSANVFVFGNINIHHRDWLTYYGGTDRPDELRWLVFLFGSLTVTLTVFLF